MQINSKYCFAKRICVLNKEQEIEVSGADRKHQTKKSIATRKAILDAAIQYFLEFGYPRTTTTEIAKRANVTRGAIQYYFPTTPDVLHASINQMIDEWIETYAKELSGMTQTGDRFSAGVDIYWSLMQHPLFVAWQELNSAARTNPELKQLVDTAAERYDRRRLEVGREFYSELSHVPDDVFEVARDLLRVALEGLATSNFGKDTEARRKAVVDMLKRLMDQLLGNY